MNFSPLSLVELSPSDRDDLDQSKCYWKDVWRRLYSMRKSWQLCDLFLYSDEGILFKVHSIVLAASSSILYKQLVERKETFIERISDCEHHLFGVPAYVLQVTIDFVYGVAPKTIVNLKRLQKGADKLGITAATLFCRQQLNELEQLARGQSDDPEKTTDISIKGRENKSSCNVEVNRSDTDSPSRAQDLLLQCPSLNNLSTDSKCLVPLKKRFLLKVLSQLQQEESLTATSEPNKINNNWQTTQKHNKSTEICHQEIRNEKSEVFSRELRPGMQRSETNNTNMNRDKVQTESLPVLTPETIVLSSNDSKSQATNQGVVIQVKHNSMRCTSLDLYTQPDHRSRTSNQSCTSPDNQSCTPPDNNSCMSPDNQSCTPPENQSCTPPDNRSCMSPDNRSCTPPDINIQFNKHTSFSIIKPIDKKNMVTTADKNTVTAADYTVTAADYMVTAAVQSEEYSDYIDRPHPIPDLALGDMTIQCPYLQRLVGNVDSYSGIPIEVMDDDHKDDVNDNSDSESADCYNDESSSYRPSLKVPPVHRGQNISDLSAVNCVPNTSNFSLHNNVCKDHSMKDDHENEHKIKVSDDDRSPSSDSPYWNPLSSHKLLDVDSMTTTIAEVTNKKNVDNIEKQDGAVSMNYPIYATSSNKNMTSQRKGFHTPGQVSTSHNSVNSSYTGYDKENMAIKVGLMNSQYKHYTTGANLNQRISSTSQPYNQQYVTNHQGATNHNQPYVTNHHGVSSHQHSPHVISEPSCATSCQQSTDLVTTRSSEPCRASRQQSPDMVPDQTHTPSQFVPNVFSGFHRNPVISWYDSRDQSKQTITNVSLLSQSKYTTPNMSLLSQYKHTTKNVPFLSQTKHTTRNLPLLSQSKYTTTNVPLLSTTLPYNRHQLSNTSSEHNRCTQVTGYTSIGLPNMSNAGVSSDNKGLLRVPYVEGVHYVEPSSSNIVSASGSDDHIDTSTYMDTSTHRDISTDGDYSLHSDVPIDMDTPHHSDAPMDRDTPHHSDAPSTVDTGNHGSSIDNNNIYSMLKESSYIKSDAMKVYRCILPGCDYNNKIMEYIQSQLYHRHGYGNPQISCGQCSRRYFSESQLKTHFKQTHDGSQKQKQHLCEDCIEIFKTSQSLNMHQLKVHCKGKLFSCEDCTFKSPRKKDLQSHMISQHNKAPSGICIYQCQYCSYKCSDRNRFSEHEASHTQERSFKCENCGNFYATRRGLRNHKKYHSNDRPHVCNICNASFKVCAKLRDHMRLLHIQKGVKPYKCGHCDFRASVRGNVNQHIRNVHKGQPIRVTDMMKEHRKHVKDYDYANLKGSEIREVKDASAAGYASVGNTREVKDTSAGYSRNTSKM